MYCLPLILVLDITGTRFIDCYPVQWRVLYLVNPFKENKEKPEKLYKETTGKKNRELTDFFKSKKSNVTIKSEKKDDNTEEKKDD